MPGNELSLQPLGARWYGQAVLHLMLLTASMLSVTGCSTQVDPVLGIERPFTLYGFLNPVVDTQAIRIFPIEGRLERTRPRPIDARVVSTEMQTGDSRTWEDSLVFFPSNIAIDTYGHVFYDTFRVQYERTYRLEVTRSDGATSSVEVTVPPRSEPELLPAVDIPGQITLPVFWPDAPRLNGVEVVYLLSGGEYVVEYSPIDLRTVPGGIVVDVQFLRDARLFFRNPPFIIGGSVTLAEIELRVLVTNEEWFPPGGVYDPDLLVEPGTFSNIENGFGFVGAGYPASITWTPEDELILKAGFEPPSPSNSSI